MCTGVEGPNGVFTNTRSRSSSHAPEARNGNEMKKARDTRLRSLSSSLAPEARNGSDSSKAQTKKAKDTKSRAFPVFGNYSFTIDEIPINTTNWFL